MAVIQHQTLRQQTSLIKHLKWLLKYLRRIAEERADGWVPSFIYSYKIIFSAHIKFEAARVVELEAFWSLFRSWMRQRSTVTAQGTSSTVGSSPSGLRGGAWVTGRCTTPRAPRPTSLTALASRLVLFLSKLGQNHSRSLQTSAVAAQRHVIWLLHSGKLAVYLLLMSEYILQINQKNLHCRIQITPMGFKISLAQGHFNKKNKPLGA